MNKLILASLFLCGAVFAKDMVYSSVVKPVYLEESSKEVAGKLLPTNALEILESKNGLVKFSITGYQNPAVPNVIYYSNGSRIISVAFSKTKTPKFEIVKKGDTKNWDEVKLVAYTKDGDFTKNVDELFAKSKKQYEENCSICHALHKEAQYTANQWPTLIKSMISRTPISKEDEWTITQYLQKHAKDSIKENK